MTAQTFTPPPAAVAPPVLSTRGLTKTHGMTTALAGVDVDLRAGESVAIMDVAHGAPRRPGGGTVVMVPVPVEPDEQQVRRALVMLAFFVLGCAVVAAGTALGLGTVWQDVHEWVFARVAGDLPG